MWWPKVICVMNREEGVTVFLTSHDVGETVLLGVHGCDRRDHAGKIQDGEGPFHCVLDRQALPLRLAQALTLRLRARQCDFLRAYYSCELVEPWSGGSALWLCSLSFFTAWG